jgi:uncharacterized repeat protein (TIGR01451 family)
MARHARPSRTPRRITAILAAALLVPFVGMGTGDADTQPNSQPFDVTMTASSDPAALGSRLTYTITTTNSQPQVADIRLSDQVAGLSDIVLTSSRGYCTVSSNLVFCEGGDMPGHGSVWVVTITGTVTGGAGTPLSNTVTVNGIWSENATSHDFSDSATTQVTIGTPTPSAQADLATSFSGPTSLSPGSNGTYQLIVSNFGGAKASDVHVSASLPVGWTLQPAGVGTSLFVCDDDDPAAISCTGGALNAGANAVITLPVTAPPGLDAGTYKFTAAADPENLISEPDDLQSDQNNFSQFAVDVPAGPAPTQPVTFTKDATSTALPKDGTQIRPGDLLTYTLTAKNTSTRDTITRLQITDGTQGLEQASIRVTTNDPKMPCTPSNNLVTCYAPSRGYTLAAGATLVVTIVGKVVQPPSTVLTNTATLQGLQGKISITRNASVTTIVRPPVDLSVTQYSTCSEVSLLAGTKGDCLPFRARNQFDYLITVGNSGLDDAAGVRVREVLPPDVIFEGYTNVPVDGDPDGAGFTCTEGSALNANPTIVTCTGGAIPGALSSSTYGGTTRQVRLHLTAPNSVGTISSTVHVDPFNTIPESDETNNTFTTSTPIATGVDLEITQAIRCPRDSRTDAVLMCNPVAPSGNVIYDITVTNLGTQDASSIKVTDLLPAGVKFRSAKERSGFLPDKPYRPDHGVSCTTSNGGTHVDCTGGRVKGIYAAYGGPKLDLTGTPDGFVIEVLAFAPAPFGPTSSPAATSAPILNQVLVDPDGTIAEYDETNNLNILETKVGIPGPQPGTQPGDWGTYNELTVSTKQLDPVDTEGKALKVAPNGTLQYELTVSNWGSDPVTNVTVTDQLPTGSRFRNVTVAPLADGTGGFNCSAADGVVTCANGSLAASDAIGTPESTTIVIRLFAPPTVNAATTRYTNHAVVDPANAIAEADETNNASDVDLVVELPAPNGEGKNTFNDLVVSNEQSKPTDDKDVAPNGTLEYTLVVTNRGTDPVDGIVVHDTYPVGARFRAADSTPPANQGGFTCGDNAGVVQCVGGSLAGNDDAAGGKDEATIKILLFAPDATSEASNSYTNHAIVDPANTIPEGDETNNTQDVSSEVSVGGDLAYNQLTITTAQFAPKQGDAQAEVAPSGTLIYRVNVANTGSDTANGVVVRDYLPADTRFRSAKLVLADSTKATGFACFHGSGVVECRNGTLLAGGTAVLEIVLFAPPQPVTVENQAVVDPGNDIPEGNEGDNTAIAAPTKVTLAGIADYHELSIQEITQTASAAVATDSVVQYTIKVANAGTDDAFNVTVRDNLPEGTQFVSAEDTTGDTTGLFTCSESGGVVDCTGGHVKGTSDPASPGTRTITVTIRSPKHSDVTFVNNKVDIVNQVIVDPDNALPEGHEANNVREITTSVKAVVDLAISALDSVSGQGTEKTMSWTVNNNGADAVTDVLLEVNLPIGVIPLDMVTVPAGWACQTTSNPINKVTCLGKLDGTGSASFTAKVYVSEDGTLHSSAIVDPDDTIEETDELNNTKQST